MKTRLGGIAGLVVWAVLGLVVMPGAARAQSLVTYQGLLEDGGVPANGVYDITVEAYDDEFAGDQRDGQTFDDVLVVDGRFEVQVDYLADLAKLEGEIWLELFVRPGASTDIPVQLSPRQLLTPAPRAGYAEQAGSVDLVLSTDVADEAGVASFLGADAGDGDLPSSYQAVAAQTIDCPSAGYILAIGVVTFELAALQGSSDSADIALSVDGSTPFQGRSWSHALAISGASISAAAWPGVAVQVIPVGAGMNTVSLLARSTDGADFADSPSLSLVFLPTAYGAVEVDSERVPGPETNIDGMRERVERLERLVLRQQREIERLRGED